MRYFVDQQSGIEVRTGQDFPVPVFCFSHCLSWCWEKLCLQYLETETCLVRQKRVKSMFLWPFGKECPPSYAREVHSSSETLTFSLAHWAFLKKTGCKSLVWQHSPEIYLLWRTLEVLFNNTVLSRHYTDPNCEVNTKLDFLFRSITNQNSTLESCNMIKKKKNRMQTHEKKRIVTLI